MKFHYIESVKIFPVCFNPGLLFPDFQHRFAEDKRRSLERLVKDKNRRSSEIFSEFMCKREEMEKIAEQNIKEVETSWQEQGTNGG